MAQPDTAAEATATANTVAENFARDVPPRLPVMRPDPIAGPSPFVVNSLRTSAYPQPCAAPRAEIQFFVVAALRGRKRCRSREFVTTLTLENAIAAPAIQGNCDSKPTAATGINNAL